MLAGMSCCAPRASCIVEASLDEVWRIVRAWDRQDWISGMDDQKVEVVIVEGTGAAVGSVRVVKLGEARMYERLVAIDDHARFMCAARRPIKWRVISHPESISPFPSASYLNFFSKMSLRDVTESDHTFVDWEGEFYTEHEHAKDMSTLFFQWFESGLVQLQAYVADQQHSRRQTYPEYSGTSRSQQPRPSFLPSTQAPGGFPQGSHHTGHHRGDPYAEHGSSVYGSQHQGMGGLHPGSSASEQPTARHGGNHHFPDTSSAWQTQRHTWDWH